MLTILSDLASDEPTLPGLSAELDPTIGTSGGLHADIYTTTYHPHSGRQPETQNFTDYSRKCESLNPPPNDEPWRPFFNTREDFEFAETLMEAGLSKGHTDRLLKLFKKCLRGDGTLTYSNYSDVLASWDLAANRLTPVSLITILENDTNIIKL